MSKNICTEAQAREIVLARLEEATKPAEFIKSVKDFTAEMFDAGLFARRPSLASVRAILDGRTYPRLTDRNGKPFQWDLVPKCPRGRRGPAAGQSFRPADVLRRLSALEMKMLSLQDDVNTLAARDNVLRGIR